MRKLLKHYRWWIVGLLFLTAVVNNLDRQTLSVLAPLLREKLQITPVQYSYVVSSFLAAYTLGYTFAGTVLDRMGVRLGLALALGFWSVVAGAHALVTGWIGLVVCRFLLGLGECFNTPAAVKAIADWVPSRERGLCIAIYNNGFVVGSIIAPPLVSFIAIQFGWRWSFITAGLLGLGLLALWLKFYNSPERSPHVSAAERDYILRERSTVVVGAPRVSMLQLLRHPVCQGFLISRFLTDPFSYFFNFWLPDYFQSARGFSLAMMGLIGWLPYLAGDIGGPGGGALSDWLIRRGWNPRRARLRLMVGAACLMPLANVAVRVETNWISLSLVALLFAAQTCWMANQLALLSESYSRVVVARVIALSAIGGGVGGILATTLTGHAVANYGYVPVFTAMSVLHLIAIVALVISLRRDRSPVPPSSNV